MDDELTTAEQKLLEALPAPPELVEIHVSNVWIVEWLPSNETRTGRMLHDWMNERRQGWSAYFSCNNKNDVVAAISAATERARNDKLRPVLHLESHGGDMGLQGPNGSGGTEMLTWDELTEHLQALNVATGCNLVVVVAACTGFAGIKALQRGPRAPAVVLVGPDAVVMPRNLLAGAKEFYRRFMDENPRLSDIAESASREAGKVNFEWEPFAILAYEALIESLVRSVRPAERAKRVQRMREQMLVEARLTNAEIQAQLGAIPYLPPWPVLQQTWDELFMIDIDPENWKRFGLDLRAIVERISSTERK
ncbi:hypothetical protein [Thiohalomonas denitrificans]|uniref:hypothetical protein n=1 Tax=Thiohalomonas denitrificans TaxID=415747 RepID=UPI0026F36616|nr:hypothetical protein [Thiohalomonas denitrificans]